MKKQSGFTLIELMVVMAIIAILATAGLSAYTGYIKKARDTTRMADLAAMNTIVLSSLSINGSPPIPDEFTTLVTAMNNGVMIADPLAGSNVCYSISLPGGSSVAANCGYTYYSDYTNASYYCKSGEYMIRAYFESASNSGLYMTSLYDGSEKYYWVGNCTQIIGGG